MATFLTNITAGIIKAAVVQITGAYLRVHNRAETWIVLTLARRLNLDHHALVAS